MVSHEWCTHTTTHPTASTCTPSSPRDKTPHNTADGPGRPGLASPDNGIDLCLRFPCLRGVSRDTENEAFDARYSLRGRKPTVKIWLASCTSWAVAGKGD